MIFKHICKKGNKYLTKIIFKEGEGEKWATTSEPVYNWAKKNFKEDDIVDVEYNIKNGQYFVTKIMKPGFITNNTPSGSKRTTKEETSKKQPEFTCENCGVELKDGKYKKCYTCNKIGEKESKEEKPICSDCGKELKDDKYEKCYTCNQKNPGKSKSTYTPKDVESIKDQVTLKASAEVIKVLTGQIGDVNTLIEMTKNVYKALRTLLK